MQDDPNITEVTPIPTPAPADNGSQKLNDLLSVMSFIAFLWGLFR